MLKIITATAALAVIMASPAWATHPGDPPAPTPPGQIQGQGQSQNQAAIAAALAAAKAKATATSASTSGGGAGGAGGLGGVGNGGNQSQGQQLNNNGAGANSNNYTQAGIPVASSTAPSFAIGQCQWAVSGGAQFFGFGGSGGGAGLYEFCKGMMKADHFRKIGREDMAKLMECGYDDFRQAYKDAGTPCRSDVPKDQLAITPVVQPVGFVAPASGPVTTASVAPVYGTTPQCFDAAGRIVPVGQAGAVRCH